MKALIATVLLSVQVIGCSSDLQVSAISRGNQAAIESVDRLSAREGETVVVTGKNLSGDLQAYVNGAVAEIEKIDATTVKIKMPPDMDPGLVKISFKNKERLVGSVTVMNSDSVESMAPASIPLANVCDSFIVKTEKGDLARGLATCAKVPTCTYEGQLDCVTSGKYAAIEKSTIPSKVSAGKSLLGIPGESTATCNE